MIDDPTYRIREITVRRDIDQIPDLIEFCFHAYLDPDGIEFIKRMRSVADEMKQHSIFSSLPLTEFSINGYVCETSDGVIIGNVNLFPARVKNRFIFLIANVCVHPDHRRHGIGASLMEAALKYAKSHFAAAVYLQVREETSDVIRMYQKLGFTEDFRRTGWIRPKKYSGTIYNPAYLKERPSARERQDFISCFRKWYPEDIIWNLNYDSQMFQFNWFSRFIHKVSQSRTEFFRVVDSAGKTFCWMGWQPTNNFSDSLWFIPTDLCTEEQTVKILSLVGSRYANFKPVQINFPKGSYTEAFRESGFFVHSRLVWMSKSL
ncbi:MAG: GNAT family N-acetyltransferase [Flexilinea sp.]